MFVKICGITNEDDALFAVAMGADALGFVFAPSTRQVSTRRVYDITRRVPPEILTVGVFKDEHPDLVVRHALDAGVKAVQLYGRYSRTQTEDLGHKFRWVIRAFSAGKDDLDKVDQCGTDLVHVDSPTPGGGKVFDWRTTAKVPAGVKMILAGGLDPDNVGSAIRSTHPWGVDVSTGVEESPGKKDATLVRRFIMNAREAAPTDQRVFDATSLQAPEDDGHDLPYDWTGE